MSNLSTLNSEEIEWVLDFMSATVKHEIFNKKAPSKKASEYLIKELEPIIPKL